MAQKKKLKLATASPDGPDSAKSTKVPSNKGVSLTARMSQADPHNVTPPPLPGSTAPPNSAGSTKAKSTKTKTAAAKSAAAPSKSAPPTKSTGSTAGKSKKAAASPGSAKKSSKTPAAAPSEPVTGPPPTPTKSATEAEKTTSTDPKDTQPSEPPETEKESTEPTRRNARRRAAGPVRGRIAANDDAPSIGGLIYALEQKPSNKPFKIAAVVSVAWTIVGLAFAGLSLNAELTSGVTFTDIITRPTAFLTLAAVVVPVSIIWFLALLAWRAEELRLRSSTMTEVAVRLAEPDRLAEQSVATLGQAVRRQVSFMNDAVSRALGRAGELEALVHNEVSALEHSYEDNERKIRSLIDELSGERHALLTTSERVTENLRTLGTEVPTLIEKLSTQQIKLAHIVQGAGENLTSLESALGTRTDALRDVLEDKTENVQKLLGDFTGAFGTALDGRTGEMQGMLENYTGALATALQDRTEYIQQSFEHSMQTLDSSLGDRTDNLQAVFEEYARALDTTLSNRAQALDVQLVERTRALDDAFSDRLRLFDAAIQRSTTAIDDAVGERAMKLNTALENHAKTFRETITLQAADLDDSLTHGISAVRRSSENITRQSIKAIEGIANQSEMLKNVSENLLSQVNTVTNRFENQGTNILNAANALENVNFKIDKTLQNRHSQLSDTLDTMSGKAEEFGKFVEGYSSSIEGSLSDADMRARATAEELRKGSMQHQQAALADLSRMHREADAEGDRAMQDLRNRFSSVSSEFKSKLGSLSNQFAETSDEVRRRAEETSRDIAAEKSRIEATLNSLPATAQESTATMRRALQDQLRALDELSSLATHEAHSRDITPPGGRAPQPPSRRLTSAGGHPPNDQAMNSLSSALAQELSGAPAPGAPAQPGGSPPYQHGAGGYPGAQPNQQQPPPQGPVGNRHESPPSAAGGAQQNRWSLGDLLDRASFAEDSDGSGASGMAQGVPQQPAAAPVSQGSPGQAAPGTEPYHVKVEVLSRALSRPVAADIWARLRQGQRGIMVRSIYSPEGQAAFDEISTRYANDPELRSTVTQYLTEFEQILKTAEQQDPSGGQTQEQLHSEVGRVYLFLAHASGKLA